MKILIASLFILLASCASSQFHKIVVLPDGSKGYVITCYEERENCEREAEKLCDNHYKVHEFLYKQSMQQEPINPSDKEDVEEDLISVFEMTVACEKVD